MAHWHAGQNKLTKLRISQCGSGHGSLNPSRRNRIDTYPGGSQFGGHRLVHAFDGMLGHRIDAAVDQRHMPELRGDMNDGTAAFVAIGIFQHSVRRSLSDQKRGTHVQCKQGIEALFFHLQERLRNIRACIVYEDIELHETANRILHCCRISHVADHGRGVAPQRANIIGNGFQLCGGPAHRNDIGPRLRQSQRNLLADPAAGTGYKRRPAFQ